MSARHRKNCSVLGVRRPHRPALLERAMVENAHTADRELRPATPRPTSLVGQHVNRKNHGSNNQ